MISTIRAAVNIISRWSYRFRQQFGGSLPSDYMTFDCETTGFDRQKDLITEFGYCTVIDKKVENRDSFLLNWYEIPEMSEFLDNRLAAVARAMQIQNRPWSITPARVKAEGRPPKEAVAAIYDILDSWQKRGMLMIGHNALRFDCPMLLSHFSQDLGKDFVFDPNLVLDTGCIEKASQLNDARALPLDGETLADYANRIIAIRAKVKWSLDGWCVPKYGLAEKHKLDAGAMHTAGEDAYVLHLLFEEYRRLAGELPPAPKPVVGHIDGERQRRR